MAGPPLPYASRRRLPPSAWLAAACAWLAMGCGGGDATDAGADAYGFQGFWVAQSWTMDFGSGVQTLTRTGSPDAILADARLTAGSATSLEVALRSVTTANDVPTAAPTEVQTTADVEGTKWIVLNPNDPANPSDDTTSVYTVSLVQGTLTLDVDPTDPRHTEPAGPQQIVFERSTPWDTTISGALQVTGMDVGSGSVNPMDCVMAGPADWTETTIDLAIDVLLILQQTTTVDHFDANGCGTSSGVQDTSSLSGYLEEQGTELRVWIYDPSGPAGGGHLVYTITQGASDVTLDRTSCTPAAYCASAAIQLALTPAP